MRAHHRRLIPRPRVEPQRFVHAYMYILTSVSRKSQRNPRGPHQLPPGRHGLSRSFVARNQRQRILAAVAEATAARGYARMSVEDVVRAAGVSRRTFYELFHNKDDVFLAAYDQVADLLIAGVRAALEAERASPPGSPPASGRSSSCSRPPPRSRACASSR